MIKFNKLATIMIIAGSIFSSSSLATTKSQYNHKVSIPSPMSSIETTHRTKVMNLSLQDAILLALHYNPAIEGIHMNQVLERFNWRVLRDTFRPHFTVNAQSTWTEGQGNSTTLSPTATLTTPLGTNISASYNQGFAGEPGNLSLELQQPLLQGFNAPHYQYEDQKTGLITERMSDIDSISQQIATVISNYRSLVETKANLQTSENDVAEAEKNLEMIKLQVKAGQKARSEIIQQESSIASTKLSIIQTKQAYEQANEEFLQSIGIDPTTKVNLTSNMEIKNYNLPDRKQTEAYALKHNIDYQKDLIALKTAERAYKEAKINTRWQLNLDVQDNQQVNIGSNNNNNGFVAPTGSRSAGLNFSAPINSLNNQQTRLSGSVGIQQAALAVKTARRELLNNVDTQLDKLHLQVDNIQQSKTAIKLAQMNLNNYLLQFKYGQVPQYQVDDAREKLLTSKLGFTSSKIDYLNDLTQLRQTIGDLLPHWNIKVRGSSNNG